MAPTQAESSLAVDPKDMATLDAMVDRYLEGVASLDVNGADFAKRVDEIRTMGDEDVRASAAVSNMLLEKPLASMTQGGLTEASNVGKSLLDLRHTVEDLDPGKQGDLFSRKKLLGVIPFGDRLRGYFDKYRSSQSHLNGIIESLYWARTSSDATMRRSSASSSVCGRSTAAFAGTSTWASSWT